MDKSTKLKERWIEQDGSIYTEKFFDKQMLASKMIYKVQEPIAFNIGQEVAQHIVALHNQHLE